MIFFNGKSIIGWLLLAAGITIILVGVLANLRIYFQPTSLFNTLMMLGAAGRRHRRDGGGAEKRAWRRTSRGT